MVTMVARFGGAMALGFAVAAPVGPTGITAIRLGLDRGAATAFWIGMGAAVTDYVYVMVTYAGLGPAIAHLSWLPLVLYVVGALVLGKMAFGALRDVIVRRRQSASGPAAASGPKNRRDLAPGWRAAFALGLSITVVNPATITSWLTLGGAFVAVNLGSVAVPVAVVILLGIGAGSAAWFTILAGLVWMARAAATRLPIMLDFVGALSGLVLLGFATSFAYQAARIVA